MSGKQKQVSSPPLSSAAGLDWVPATLLRHLKLDVTEATALSRREARWVCDAFQMIQRDRIRNEHRLRNLRQDGEPNRLFIDLSTQHGILERNLRTVMTAYANAHPVGRWMQSLAGIGAVMTTELLAYINIEQRPTCGRIWRFAGLDPSSAWVRREKADSTVNQVIRDLGGESQLISKEGEVCRSVVTTVAKILCRNPTTLLESALYIAENIEYEKPPIVTVSALQKAASQRPWCEALHRICWNLGESFMRREKRTSLYGDLIWERRRLEDERNAAGLLADEATRQLQIKHYGRGTYSYKCYIKGKLPERHLRARARRYGVKIFLSHLHHVMWWERFKEPPPKPYILEHSNGVHKHLIEVPNFPFEDIGRRRK